MMVSFTVDYKVNIDLDLIGYTEEEFKLLSHYAKQSLITEWRTEWIGEDIYDVGVCDE